MLIYGLTLGSTPTIQSVSTIERKESLTLLIVACRGDMADPFSKVGSHYNPQGCLHPYHAGDLPPLWEANGYAFSAFLTARFAIEDIVGKTVVVHAGLDDLTTQPSGNAGAKIACGEIRAVMG